MGVTLHVGSLHTQVNTVRSKEMDYGNMKLIQLTQDILHLCIPYQ